MAECTHAVRPSLVLMSVLNPPSGPLHDWECYWIEYGFECTCPKGRIWLPRGADPERAEAFLGAMINASVTEDEEDV